MKQYVQPELKVYEVMDDLLTVTNSAEQGNGLDNIKFDWETPDIFG